MDWERGIDRAEQAVEFAAAVMFATAIGFCLWAIELGIGVAMTAAVATFVAAKSGLAMVTPETRPFPLPDFSPAAIESVPAAPGGAGDELILEDKLGEVSPDARVVRLFGPSQNHRSSSHSQPEPPDASQALSDALAELRRSLC